MSLGPTTGIPGRSAINSTAGTGRAKPLFGSAGAGHGAGSNKANSRVEEMLNVIEGRQGSKKWTVIIGATAIMVTLERIAKLIATGGEKAVINKHSKKGLKAVSGKIGDKARSAVEWVDDTLFAAKGKIKRVFGNPAKKAAKVEAKAAKAAEKAALKAGKSKKPVSATV